MVDKPEDSGKPDESPLRKKLRELSQFEGVRRDNLYDFLGAELRDIWHVRPADPDVVRAVVTAQLKRLISKLKNKENQVTAEYSYNITGKPAVEDLDLGQRQDWLSRNAHGPGAKNSRLRMTDTILPQFETNLRAAPPAPVTSEELAAVLGRPLDSNLLERALDRTSAGSAQLIEPATGPRVSEKQRSEPDAKRTPRMYQVLAIGVVLAIVGGLALFWTLNRAQPDEPQAHPSGTAEGSPYALSIGPAVGPGKTITEVQGSLGSMTVKDPRKPSVTGVKVPPHVRVEVSCKVHAPSFESVQPDGYWYRIASAPWNNEWYAIANTFLNGDQPGGPTEHNTDFAVPDC